MKRISKKRVDVGCRKTDFKMSTAWEETLGDELRGESGGTSIPEYSVWQGTGLVVKRVIRRSKLGG